MREVRITFGSDDFAAVTSHMIELGVRFRVEPLDDDAAPPAPPARGRREAKPKAAARKQPAAATGRESAGAARLRAMAERNRAAAGKPEGETGEGTRSPPDAGSPFGDT